jgi:uncharacterized Ntn-hydrolase superfamily protein
VTYSIVARDAATGQLGVAVQTCMFAAGAGVPWARPGVGAVASQAIALAAYGPRCLDAIGAGSTATEALEAAKAADPMAALRQVGVVAADGTVAAWSGELCIDHAGHLVGDGFCVQANMMSSPGVWPAMAAAFETADGPLSRRLLASLVAGEEAGGDARGRMSAALVVVDAAAATEPGDGTIVDLRVDCSGDPLGALGALLDTADAFAGYHRAVDQLVGGDPAGALQTIDAALERCPGDENMRFVRSGALMGAGEVDAGIAELRALIAARPTWEVVLRSFAAKGMLAVPDGVSIDAVLG